MSVDALAALPLPGLPGAPTVARRPIRRLSMPDDMTRADPQAIEAYHAHIYYDPAVHA